MLVSPAIVAGAAPILSPGQNMAASLMARADFQLQLGKLLSFMNDSGHTHARPALSAPQPAAPAPVFLPDLNAAPAAQTGGACAPRKDRKKSGKDDKRRAEHSGTR